MILTTALLAIALAMLGWSTWRSQRQYALFKTYTETRDRQRFYRRWLISGLLEFGLGTVVALALLGRLDAVIRPPPAFAAIGLAMRTAAPLRHALNNGAFVGFGIGVVIGGTALAIMSRMRRGKATTVVLGDIQALLPRNGAETGLCALLSINAGVGEELFFRLLLPLLIATLTGDPRLGFLAAGAIFGLAHVYQGWVGIVATTIIGLVLTAIYLWVGQLWIAMAVHAAFDLVGLVIRPSISRALARRAADALFVEWNRPRYRHPGRSAAKSRGRTSRFPDAVQLGGGASRAPDLRALTKSGACPG